MIYVLLPTRGRVESLIQSIMSLYANKAGSDGRDTFKVSLAIDPDDRSTLDAVEAMRSDGSTIEAWIAPERYGYGRLYEYYNVLASRAMPRDDDLLVLWNDDAVMKTLGWDTALAEADPEGLVLDLQSNLSPQFVCFPAVRGSLYRALGWYSRDTPHIDSYLQDIARSLGRVRPVDVFVEHNRPDLVGSEPDATFTEGRAGLDHHRYFSREFQQLIASDIERVREALCL